MQKIKSIIVLVPMLFFIIFCVKGASATRLYVDPPIITNTYKVGDTFSVNVRVENVNDLAGFEFKLYWNPTVLSLDQAIIWTSDIWSSQYWSWAQENNIEGGYYHVAFTKKNTVSTFSGSTSLATIYFKVKWSGVSALNLNESTLGDSNANNMTYQVDNGMFYYCLGDVTGPSGVPDGKVDIRDVNLVAKYYGTYKGGPPSSGGYSYDPRIDLNYDGKIDIKDVHTVASLYGTTCTSSASSTTMPSYTLPYADGMFISETMSILAFALVAIELIVVMEIVRKLKHTKKRKKK